MSERNCAMCLKLMRTSQGWWFCLLRDSRGEECWNHAKWESRGAEECKDAEKPYQVLVSGIQRTDDATETERTYDVSAVFWHEAVILAAEAVQADYAKPETVRLLQVSCVQKLEGCIDAALCQWVKRF